MSNIIFLEVDGVPLCKPSAYDPTYGDVWGEGSFVSETGVLNQYKVRSNRKIIAVEWGLLTLSELQTILRCVSNDNQKSSFTLKYFDYFSGTYKTGNFYASDRLVKTKQFMSTSNSCFSLSLNFIEL